MAVTRFPVDIQRSKKFWTRRWRRLHDQFWSTSFFPLICRTTTGHLFTGDCVLCSPPIWIWKKKLTLSCISLAKYQVWIPIIPLFECNWHIHGPVYKIPPLNANEGYRANDWGDLSLPLWKGRLRITQNSKGATLHLEDSQTGKSSRCFHLLHTSANATVLQENVRHLIHILLVPDEQQRLPGLLMISQSHQSRLS